LEKQGKTIKGSVLNVGSANDEYNYKRFFPHATIFHNLDKRNRPNVDIVADVEWMPQATNSEDCIVACFMLYDVSNPQVALNEFRRVLKPNGVLLATFQTPFTKTETLSLLEKLRIEEFEEYFEDGQLICVFIRAMKLGD